MCAALLILGNYLLLEPKYFESSSKFSQTMPFPAKQMNVLKYFPQTMIIFYGGGHSL
jgi:heptaprenylglyceryl phosphate synthase